MRYLLILLFIFSLPSRASTCVLIDENGFLRNSGASVELCNDMVLLDANEYKSINVDSIIATLKDLFEFSAEDMGAFVASGMVMFITGHGAGRVVRILGRS